MAAAAPALPVEINAASTTRTSSSVSPIAHLGHGHCAMQRPRPGRLDLVLGPEHRRAHRDGQDDRLSTSASVYPARPARSPLAGAASSQIQDIGNGVLHLRVALRTSSTDCTSSADTPAECSSRDSASIESCSDARTITSRSLRVSRTSAATPGSSTGIVTSTSDGERLSCGPALLAKPGGSDGHIRVVRVQVLHRFPQCGVDVSEHGVVFRALSVWER
jgi:hypothetical protein